MSKNIRLDIQNYVADDAIGKMLIAKYGDSDNDAALATAATDKLLGVSCDLAAAATERTDICRLGSTPVIYGGNVTRGDYLTAGAGGKAVAITLPVEAASVEVIGKAEVSGVADDIGSVFVNPFVIYGGPVSA